MTMIMMKFILSLMCSALQYYDFSWTKSSYHAKNIAFDKYNWITLFVWAMMPIYYMDVVALLQAYSFTY